MPSATSQAHLVRQTYERAGLDIQKDRCQYFEAHGTGTKAGDPQEASAIYKAFFGDSPNTTDDDPLYVGSIKTVIGHTEGTAGLAGVLRASLGMKHGYIPPNLLFDELNPDIEPYYGRLQIVKDAAPWPALPAGVPKRASVNSFGESCLGLSVFRKLTLVQDSVAPTPMPFWKATSRPSTRRRRRSAVPAPRSPSSSPPTRRRP